MKAIAGLLSMFVYLPIWYFLMYSILTRVNATDVMWLLFWVYIPVSLLTHACTKLAADS